MPRNPNRRSISVKGTTYQRLKNYQERTGEASISGFTENLILRALDEANEPVVRPEDVPKPKPKPKKEKPTHGNGSGVFTF